MLAQISSLGLHTAFQWAFKPDARSNFDIDGDLILIFASEIVSPPNMTALFHAHFLLFWQHPLLAGEHENAFL